VVIGVTPSSIADAYRVRREPAGPARRSRPRPYHPGVAPIDELIRIEPIYLGRLERQGVFTTGLLLEVTETPTRRQYLADQVDATTNDVLTWRDEAQMLNLAGFGQPEHRLLSQSGFEGLKDIQAVDLDTFRKRVARGADELKMELPSDLTIQGWWDQAHTLAE
jgi:hypothetical protein